MEDDTLSLSDTQTSAGLSSIYFDSSRHLQLPMSEIRFVPVTAHASDLRPLPPVLTAYIYIAGPISAAATAPVPSHSAGSGSFAGFHVSPAAAVTTTAEGVTEVSKSLRVSLVHLRRSNSDMFHVLNDSRFELQMQVACKPLHYKLIWRSTFLRNVN